jgi:hypothetical protein
MPRALTARYRDAAGRDHQLRLEHAPCGRWRVLDVGPGGERLIEELCGHDDRRAQAEALARDYAQQAALAARGQRPADRDDDDVLRWAA